MQIPSRQSFFRVSILSLLVVLASGCSSGPNIRSDYDKGADFASYRTYDFVQNAGSNTGNYQSLFSQYMETAIGREMQSRGYTKSANPDLLVNFHANFEDKTKVTQTSTPNYGGYYGYRGYGAWGGYGYSNQTHVSQYTEGTFNIDLVDARKRQLVWEAVAVGRVDEDSFENLEQKVNEGVPQFFAQYPFRAGDGVPSIPAK